MANIFNNSTGITQHDMVAGIENERLEREISKLQNHIHLLFHIVFQLSASKKSILILFSETRKSYLPNIPHKLPVRGLQRALVYP
jgi:hypothetical protein